MLVYAMIVHFEHIYNLHQLLIKLLENNVSNWGKKRDRDFIIIIIYLFYNFLKKGNLYFKTRFYFRWKFSSLMGKHKMISVKGHMK